MLRDALLEVFDDFIENKGLLGTLSHAIPRKAWINRPSVLFGLKSVSSNNIVKQRYDNDNAPWNYILM